jgi:hypothetical protein
MLPILTPNLILKLISQPRAPAYLPTFLSPYHYTLLSLIQLKVHLKGDESLSYRAAAWHVIIRVLHTGSNTISQNFNTDWILRESRCLYPEREMQAVVRFDTVTLRCQKVAVVGTGFAANCYWIIHDSRDKDRTSADSFPENYRRKLKKRKREREKQVKKRNNT